MKKCLLLILLSVSVFVWGKDTVPIEGTWSEKGLRSLSPIPFSVEKEGNTLYIYSYTKIEDVTVRVVSSSGIVCFEETSTFHPFDCMCLPLDGLAQGAYFIELSQNYKKVVGSFILEE